MLALAMPGKILDPRLAVERVFAVSPHARSSDPAFMIPSAKGPVPLTLCFRWDVETLSSRNKRG